MGFLLRFGPVRQGPLIAFVNDVLEALDEETFTEWVAHSRASAIVPILSGSWVSTTEGGFWGFLALGLSNFGH